MSGFIRTGVYRAILRSPYALLQFGDDFIVLGESADLVLAEYLLPVGDYVEHAASAANQLRLDAQRLFNRDRQTDGFGFKVSLIAIRDA